jgi:uncharacterized membrane protein
MTVLESSRASDARPERQNVQRIAELERAHSAHRTAVERIVDGVAAAASRPAFIALHVAWFAAWLAINRGAAAFDPFPFSLLTLVVSLEAILLTAFILMAQNRMTAQADRRAELDLQINILAEQELTAILSVLTRLAAKADIDLSADPLLQRFLCATDVEGLADLLERTETSKPANSTAASSESRPSG